MFWSKNKKEIGLLININNGKIDVSIVDFTKKNRPNFLHSISFSFTESETDTTKLSDNIISLLDSNLKNFLKKSWHSIDWGGGPSEFSRVMVSISSPWPTIKIKEIFLSKDIPFIITNKFIGDIVSKEKELFRKELTNKELEIIEKSIIHTKINGYEVSNVINSKTKNFDAYFYTSAISKKVGEQIHNIISKNTHISKERVSIHSMPLVMFSVIRDYFHKESSFILININSLTTDIILVNDHVIKSVTSFPFGRATIIRQISRVFNVSPEIAESQFIMYLSQRLDSSVSISIDGVLQEIEKEWSIYLEDVLVNISPNLILPKKVFLMTDPDTADIFTNFIKLPKEDTTSVFRKNAEIVLLNDNFVSNLYQNSVGVSIDISSILLALFYSKSIQN